MPANIDDLTAFVCVARAGGFRKAGRTLGASPTSLSDTLRRLENRMGVRLLHRTTRSVSPTEAGERLLNQLTPLLASIDEALAGVASLRDTPAGTLKLNVPVGVARLILPTIIPPFLDRYPDIRVEVVADDSIIDVLAAGADAGIRYEETLEQDMIAVPIGPRTQMFAMAAAPSYLEAAGVPVHPADLLNHRCLLGRFGSGSLFSPWELERDDESIRVEPKGPLTVSISGAMDLAVDAAVQGAGIIGLFEEWLQPHMVSGRLVPVLPQWWASFPGPSLYYSGRRLVPPPLKSFIDFVKAQNYEARG